MHQQYKDSLEETQDKKLPMHVALDDERVVIADLKHQHKNKEAIIAQLNSKLSTTVGGKTGKRGGSMESIERGVGQGATATPG